LPCPLCHVYLHDASYSIRAFLHWLAHILYSHIVIISNWFHTQLIPLWLNFHSDIKCHVFIITVTSCISTKNALWFLQGIALYLATEYCAKKNREPVCCPWPWAYKKTILERVLGTEKTHFSLCQLQQFTFLIPVGYLDAKKIKSSQMQTYIYAETTVKRCNRNYQ
jgi:hypothetical protein